MTKNELEQEITDYLTAIPQINNCLVILQPNSARIIKINNSNLNARNFGLFEQHFSDQDLSDLIMHDISQNLLNEISKFLLEIHIKYWSYIKASPIKNAKIFRIDISYSKEGYNDSLSV